MTMDNLLSYMNEVPEVNRKPVKECFTIKLSDNLKTNLKRICSREIKELEGRMNYQFTAKQKASIFQKSLDLVDHSFRDISSNRIISIFDSDHIELKKINHLDDDTFEIEVGINKGLKINRNKAQEMIECILKDNFKTSVLYCALGHRQKLTGGI